MTKTANFATKELLSAIDQGNAEQVRFLIQQGECNCKHHGSKPLRDAVKLGHIDIVAQLLPHSNPDAFYSGALVEAVKSGRADLFDLIFSSVDPTVVQDQAIGKAIVHDHLTMFHALLPRVVHDTAIVDHLIVEAAQYGRDQMLEELLPHANVVRPDTLKWAARGRSARCVELLLPLCNITDDFYGAWRGAFAPYTPDVIRVLVPHVDVNMFNHFGLARALMVNDTSIAQMLFEFCDRETVMADVINDIARRGNSSEQAEAVATLEQWLNQEQNQRIHSASVHSAIQPSPAVRRKI